MLDLLTMERMGEGPILIALSGGGDSVALLHFLTHHVGAARLRAAIVDHKLREGSGADARKAEDIADAAGVEAYVLELIWADSANRAHEAARALRYAALCQAARKLGARVIATGHTRDDQAETLLLKLIRGAGLTGLAAIYPRRGAIVRPLLDVARTDLRSYLEERGQSWVEDETNQDLENPRNRIRRLVLPELDRAYGSATTPAIARAAALIREDAAYLDDVSERRYTEVSVPLPESFIQAGAGTAQFFTAYSTSQW